MTNTLGSICSGYGGLELGISQVIPTETLWVADYEPPKNGVAQKQSAALILAHRFRGVPNLGDITVVDWATTQPVKVLCGGTPCQDVSEAGARKGMRAGTRSGIWAPMVEAITQHQPTLVVWENVGGALSAGADSSMEPCPICVGDQRDTHLRTLGRVLGDLAEIGYDAVWCCVRASDVGAPHRRERVFVVAWPVRDTPDQFIERARAVGPGPARSEGQIGRAGGPAAQDTNGTARGESGIAAPGKEAGGGARADAGRARAVADPDRPGSQGAEPTSGRNLPDGCSTPDAPGDGRDEGRAEPEGQLGRPDAAERGTANRDVQWGQFGPAVRRWESVLGRPAPAPTGLSTRGGQALSPRFVEWMMGLPPGWVTDVPGLTRNDQLKALGNGVVPQQAALAVRYLLGFAPEWVQVSTGFSTPVIRNPA